jgi:phosphate uptake regulator
MDYRKLVNFGKSSLVVTLPKKWTDKYKLSAGDHLLLKEIGKGIIFFPEGINSEPNQVTNTIQVDELSKDQLKRQIITHYIRNTNVLYLSGKTVSEKQENIRSTLSNLIAFELIEQNTNRLTVRDFLDMDNLSIKNLVKRIDMILRSMMIDAKQSSGTDETDMITNRDKDINKLSYLIFRKINYLNMNPSAKREISNTDLIKYWVLTNHLETIGDEVKRIARLFSRLRIAKKSKKLLLNQFEVTSQWYLKILGAFYNRDVAIAYRLADEKENQFNALNDLFNSLSSSPSLISIHEKLKTIITHLNDIGKLVYN